MTLKKHICPNCGYQEQKALAPTRKNKHSTSKYRGVSADPKGGFAAKITVNGKTTYLGYFGDQVSAAKQYDDVAKLVFGDKARLNFK